MESGVHDGHMIPSVPVPPPVSSGGSKSIYVSEAEDTGSRGRPPKTTPEVAIRFPSHPSLLPAGFLASSRTGNFGQNTEPFETSFSHSDTCIYPNLRDLRCVGDRSCQHALARSYAPFRLGSSTHVLTGSRGSGRGRKKTSHGRRSAFPRKYKYRHAAALGFRGNGERWGELDP